jgi:hypothetical protein
MLLAFHYASTFVAMLTAPVESRDLDSLEEPHFADGYCWGYGIIKRVAI